MTRPGIILLAALTATACTKDDGVEHGARDGAGHPSAMVVQPPMARPDLQEILDHHFDALGGRERHRQARTLTYQVEPEGGGDRIHIYRKRPASLRKEYGCGDEMKVEAFDGQTAWYREPGQPPAVLTAEKAGSLRRSARFDDPLLDAPGGEVDARLAGRDRWHGQPAWVVELAFADGTVQRRFIDARTYLELGREVVFARKNGGSASISIGFSDYAEVHGIMINHAFTVEHEGGVDRYRILEPEYDAELSDALFQLDQS